MKDPNLKIKDTLDFKNKIAFKNSLIEKYMSQGIDVKSNFPNFKPNDTIVEGKSDMSGPKNFFQSPLVSAKINYDKNVNNAKLGNARPDRTVTIGQPDKMSYVIQGLFNKDKIDN